MVKHPSPYIQTTIYRQNQSTMHPRYIHPFLHQLSIHPSIRSLIDPFEPFLTHALAPRHSARLPSTPHHAPQQRAHSLAHSPALSPPSIPSSQSVRANPSSQSERKGECRLIRQPGREGRRHPQFCRCALFWNVTRYLHTTTTTTTTTPTTTTTARPPPHLQPTSHNPPTTHDHNPRPTAPKPLPPPPHPIPRRQTECERVVSSKVRRGCRCFPKRPGPGRRAR